MYFECKYFFWGVLVNRLASFTGVFLTLCCLVSTSAAATSSDDRTLACVDELSSMALPTLASKYQQTDAEPSFEFVTTLALPGQRDGYSERYYPEGVSAAATYVISFKNSGLRQYARLDLPATRGDPAPILVYAHGYVGYPKSLSFALAYDTESMSGEFIARWVEAGFAVLSPGYRGHGTFNGLPAEGAEYLALWDSGGTFLTPTFYAQDVLAAIDALPTLDSVPAFEGKIALDAVALLGHSQGGDVALTVLAIDALAERKGPAIVAASIWAGCIGDRVDQLNFYPPMQTTRKAFVAGDDIWRRSDRGADGSVNAEFLWPWPQDWTPGIVTDEHGWQPDAREFNQESVAEVQAYAHDRLMKTVRECAIAAEPAEVLAQIRAAGGAAHASAIKTPVRLHTSNQDFYSPPRWNHALAAELNDAGAEARVLIYPANTHALKASDQAWFSPASTKDGLPQAIAHDSEFFRSALARYRDTLKSKSSNQD